jgi:uncharacterized protein YjbJ (UPF0337 family)
MNTTEIKGNWNEVKGKLKQQYATLADDDLFLQKGRLQIKLGKTKEELKNLSPYYN